MMSIPGNEEDEGLVEIFQRLKALERQAKQLNTFVEYLNRFIAVEKRLGLLNFQVKSMGVLEEQLLIKVKQVIQIEMEPVQHMMRGLHTRISRMESQIASLDKRSLENQRAIQLLLQNKSAAEEAMKENPHAGQPIIYQEIHIDKLFMDKYEQTNNLGQLGINELSGHLTIGASYDKGVIPNELVEEWKKEMNQLNQFKENQLNQKTDDDRSINEL